MRLISGVAAFALVLGLGGIVPLAVPAPAAAQTAASRFPALLTAADRQIYLRAFAAGSKGDWDGAAAIALAARDRTLAKVIDWQRIQAQSAAASFETIAQFVERNPDWPRRSTTLARAEAALTGQESATRLLAWFTKFPPASGLGKIRYGAALMATADRARGLLMLRQGWIEADMTTAVENDILARFQSMFTQADHIARLQRLLMDEDVTEARRMLSLVPSDYRASATAAIAFIMKASSAGRDLAAVPAARAQDPGLLYARVRYLRSLDQDDQAVELISRLPEGVAAQNPGRWWPHLRYATHRLLNAGRYADAYRVARAHDLSDGVDYFDAEFTAGWVALRFLRQPEAALRHFTAMAGKVQSPISTARANYWGGRAAAALGQREAARAWYAKAAVHSQTFYGQLAAFELGEASARALPADPRPSAGEQSAVERGELYRAIRMLLEIDEKGRIRPFLKAAMEATASPGGRAHIAEMAGAAGGAYAGVIAAKEASFVGTFLGNRGYPLLNMPNGELTEKALSLALTRQESEFRSDAVSPAGARGLMQLMPGTAKLVAKSLGLKFEPGKLTTDPQYNMTLGVAHLDELLNDFGGSYAMVIGAYNAGGGRIDTWIGRYGDPRSSDVDVVDWIERIPFEETRNYVQRVLENTQVYRLRLAAGKAVPLGIARDLLRGSGSRTSPVVDQAYRATSG
ncbi:lytic transglycosylase domain-containing protein [Zavarzinia compransoris]|uniref:Lytic murein transglycosylase n=1 Tax=Zavarzinia compransoris TaxID=1264899 RepID=A0A317E366_9PROT|nr:lytic transglycosylase domain-containing protein [Zavarzinia compransoris]PWR21032.1 lytic murein transglycosylase [Zavarzinia compransoris]TDP44064.1 soluble lytic murein transglycosylase [Zavarzinia compransoris]